MVAVAEGQADVQQDQVGPKGLELLQHALEIHHAMDLPAPGIQVLGHRARDGLVVLYENKAELQIELPPQQYFLIRFLRRL